jgi:hypothetical protein
VTDPTTADPGHIRSWEVHMRKLFTILSTLVVAMTTTLIGAGPASAQVYCDPGWIKVGTSLTNVWSPWFTTKPDPYGSSQKISFHVLSGIIARYQNQYCTLGPPHYFDTASEYKISGPHNPPGPYSIGYHNRNYRWPDECAGFDELASWWVHWTDPGCD